MRHVCAFKRARHAARRRRRRRLCRRCSSYPYLRFLTKTRRPTSARRLRARSCARHTKLDFSISPWMTMTVSERACWRARWSSLRCLWRKSSRVTTDSHPLFEDTCAMAWRIPQGIPIDGNRLSLASKLMRGSSKARLNFMSV